MKTIVTLFTLLLVSTSHAGTKLDALITARANVDKLQSCFTSESLLTLHWSYEVGCVRNSIDEIFRPTTAALGEGNEPVQTLLTINTCDIKNDLVDSYFNGGCVRSISRKVNRMLDAEIAKERKARQ